MAAKNLVIVESPAKAKTLEKYLGRDFQVKASVGHVIDLPKSKLGVDIKKDFAPDFTVIQGKPMPLAGADVYYTSRAYGPDVSGYTDRDGRYSLCGIPSMPGTLSMYCGNDILAYRQELDIRADTALDIDATSFYKCLVPAPRRQHDAGRGDSYLNLPDEGRRVGVRRLVPDRVVVAHRPVDRLEVAAQVIGVDRGEAAGL